MNVPEHAPQHQINECYSSETCYRSGTTTTTALDAHSLKSWCLTGSLTGQEHQCNGTGCLELKAPRLEVQTQDKMTNNNKQQNQKQQTTHHNNNWSWRPDPIKKSFHISLTLFQRTWRSSSLLPKWSTTLWHPWCPWKFQLFQSVVPNPNASTCLADSGRHKGSWHKDLSSWSQCAAAAWRSAATLQAHFIGNVLKWLLGITLVCCMLSAPCVSPKLSHSKTVRKVQIQIMQHGDRMRFLNDAPCQNHQMHGQRSKTSYRNTTQESRRRDRHWHALSANAVRVRGNNCNLRFKGNPHNLQNFPLLSTRAMTHWLQRVKMHGNDIHHGARNSSRRNTTMPNRDACIKTHQKWFRWWPSSLIKWWSSHQPRLWITTVVVTEPANQSKQEAEIGL